MTREKAVTLVIEIADAGRRLEVGENKVDEFADRILQASQPKWHYPERGEWPENSQRVWFIVLNSDEVYEGVFGRDKRCKPSEWFFEPEYESKYPASKVRCWSPIIIPQPPAE